LDKSGMLIMDKVVEMALSYFDRNVMCDTRLRKKSSAPQSKGVLAAQEDVYQKEMLAVFKSWFGPGVEVVSQPVTVFDAHEKRVRCRHSDILIERELQRILLKLVAHATFADVKERVDRAERDAIALGAGEAWVLHFSTGDFGDDWPSEKLDVSTSSIQIHVMDIKHDSEWSVLTIRMKGRDAHNVSLAREKV
jgi:hypothetical protein